MPPYQELLSKLISFGHFTGAQQRGFQCGIIYSPEEVVQDVHFIDRGFPLEIHHPELNQSFIYPGVPYKFLGSPCEIKRRPPLLGEHTVEVLLETGYTPENIEVFQSENILG
ncbi:MAG TPA: hypothetical protein EYQ00_14435 [Dehalococcoidia bacterium]|nr:hypothetical protein [Dehalococcoidia bacterium]